MLVESALVVAVAPGGVLERCAEPMVDQKPGTPCQCACFAGEYAPGDLALAERVAPVFDAQPSSCSAVVGVGDVADSEHAFVRAHLRVGEDRSLDDHKARSLG